MSEPDFDQIARAALHLNDGAGGKAGSHITVDALSEQLRLIWNARGVADVEAATKDLVGSCIDGRHDDPDNSGQCIRCGVVLDFIEPEERVAQILHALRTLDR